MLVNRIYNHLERLGHLLKAGERKMGKKYGLQPVQLEALYYLSRCNKYSNHVVGVTEYLGLTKGTVSQTLRVLENKGYLARVPHAQDRRKVHLEITEAGKEVLLLFPPPLLRDGCENMTESAQEQIVAQLNLLLETLQRADLIKTFGICETCQHFITPFEGVYQCGFTKERLYDSEINLICREHVTNS